MSRPYDLHLPAHVQRQLGQQLGLIILRDMAHQQRFMAAWQFNAAVYGLQQIVRELGVRDLESHPSFPGGLNANCRVLTPQNEIAYLKVVGHPYEALQPSMLREYRRQGIPAAEVLAGGGLSIRVPNKRCGSYAGTYLMTRALSGENVQRALDRGRARGADGAEISAAELLRHTDQFAHRVLHVDLADADPARRARAWNESFVAQNSFPASCFERLAEIDRRYAPPPNPSIVVWTIGRPQALVHMDLVPMNIIYDIRRSAGKENVDVEHAIIDPDRAVMAPRAMATAFYVARTRDPLLWTSNSMWLDPLTRGIEPVDMVAAMSYFLTLEGSRKSVGPVSLVQSFGTDVYSARRRQHLRELEELPDGPYKRAAMETIRDREMTESRRDQFEDEAEAAFAVTRKYWDHAQELTETWRDLCRSPGEHLAGRGLQGRFP